MTVNSKIEWTHHTFNPWWGCTRVSPGCEHCYAETFAKRTGLGWGPRADRRFFTDKHWNEPLRWNAAAERAGERHRVFCASMADVFEDRPELVQWRRRLWTLIEATPALDWLLLTKRPENWHRMVPQSWMTVPRPNVWAMTTAEDQARANQRIPELLNIPAVIRGVSYEPALEAVDFERWLDPTGVQCPDVCPGRRFVLESEVETVRSGDEVVPLCPDCGEVATWTGYDSGLDWLIVGGESGPGARPFDLAWARSVVEQCRAADTKCFVKQLGARPVDSDVVMSLSDCGWPAHIKFRADHKTIDLRDRKGGDWSEWPEDLRVREFPS